MHEIIEYEFTAERGIEDHKDRSYKMREFGESPHDAIVRLVTANVDEFLCEEDYEIAKAKAAEFIARKFGGDNWTTEWFCDSWIDLWPTDWEIVRVYDMKVVRRFKVLEIT